MDKTVSNYVRQTVAAREAFLQWDQRRMIQQFSLQHDDQFLYLPFFAEAYRICRKTGRVERIQADGTQREGNFEEVFSIYDALCREKKGTLSGRYCSVNALPNVVRSSGLGDRLYDEAVERFRGKTAELARACRQLGGAAEPGGDMAYRLPVFPFLPVIVRFWDGDDEFAPQMRLLWDERTQEFVRYETTYYIASHLLRRLEFLVSGVCRPAR